MLCSKFEHISKSIVFIHGSFVCCFRHDEALDVVNEESKGRSDIKMSVASIIQTNLLNEKRLNDTEHNDHNHHNQSPLKKEPNLVQIAGSN